MSGGKTQILYSSTITTNAPTDSTFTVRGMDNTTIYAKVDAITSGATLTININAYPAAIDAPNISTYTIPLVASGDVTLQSGQSARWNVSDAYDNLGVGVMNSTSNKSGRVTVIITRSRR